MLRRSYTIKPPPGTPIIPGHPLAQGLIKCYTLADVPRIFDGVRNVFTNVGSGNTWSLGRYGRCLNFDGSINVPDFGNDTQLDFGNNPYSILVVASLGGTTGTIQTFVAKGVAGSSAPGWRFLANTWNTNNGMLFLEWGSNGGNGYVTSGTGVVPMDGTPNMYVAVKNPNIPLHKLYKNGTIVGTSINTAAQVDSPTPYRWGVFSNEYPSANNSKTFLVYIWNRALYSEEVLDLYVNPYAMFEQPRRGKWFFVAAGELSIPVAMANYRQRSV